MTFAPTAAMMRQVKSGKSTATPVKAPAAQEVAASAIAIDLSGDHPAAGQLDKPEEDNDTAVPQKAAPVTKSRFGNIQISKSDSESAPAAEPAGRFDSIANLENTPRAKQSKIGMAAVKALTPLVAAISFKPGSRSEPAVKSKALADLVSKVQASTTDVAMAMGPYFANNDWARSQIMTTIAGIAAQQWEKHGQVDVGDIGRCMSNAFREPSIELQSALNAFEGSDKYVEATSPDIAKARLSVTICGAAWELHDWIVHESLRLKTPVGEGSETIPMPSRVFSYGLPVATVVESLLGKIIDESRGFELQIQSQDLRLAHLQGTIRRMTQIAGAEYVTQTAAIHQWLNESPNEAENVRRQQMAQEQFQTHVVPRVMEWARANFAAVENKAQSMLGELSQDAKHEEKTRQAAR